jgi:hypothetical protein
MDEEVHAGAEAPALSPAQIIAQEHFWKHHQTLLNRQKLEAMALAEQIARASHWTWAVDCKCSAQYQMALGNTSLLFSSAPLAGPFFPFTAAQQKGWA